MTSTQTPAPVAEREDAATGFAELIRSAPVEVTYSQASKTASLLFVGGLALSGLLSGTATTAPMAEPQVRYVGSWTSTARTLGPGAGGSTGAPRTPRGHGDRPQPPTAAVTAQRPVAANTAAPAGDASASTDRMTQAAEVRWLREASGLTWDQLGRLFGVSRRAVHLWANGGRMNAANAEALAQLVAVVRELPGGADERRAALLTPNTDGLSIVDQFRARHRSDVRDFAGNPFRPQELLGALHDGSGDGPAQHAGGGSAQA